MHASKGRVIARIGGGLGNQLFQYAAARRLSVRNGVPLTLDHISGFPRDFYKRSFLLNHFHIQCDYVDPPSRYATFGGRILRRIHIYLNRNRDLNRKTYILEQVQSFDPRMLDLRVTRDVYLEGYWHYEEYFKDIRDQLSRELALRTPHDAINIEIAKRIQEVESVCVHARRLRNVPNIPDARPVPTRPEEHLDASYYMRALEIMAKRLRDPHLFVFSDYPDWAREHIRVPFPTEFVTHNGADKDYEDFWLMGQCKHFVIANSTFSWWAAWLAGNPNKIVIAPKAGIGHGLRSTPDSWLLM